MLSHNAAEIVDLTVVGEPEVVSNKQGSLLLNNEVRDEDPELPWPKSVSSHLRMKPAQEKFKAVHHTAQACRNVQASIPESLTLHASSVADLIAAAKPAIYGGVALLRSCRGMPQLQERSCCLTCLEALEAQCWL